MEAKRVRIDPVVQVIIAPTEDDKIIEKSELKLIIQNDPTESSIVSHKNKLSSIDAEWWVTVYKGEMLKPKYRKVEGIFKQVTPACYEIPVKFHLAQPKKLNELKSYSVCVYANEQDELYPREWVQLENVSYPWTSKYFGIRFETKPTIVEVTFVFTIRDDCKQSKSTVFDAKAIHNEFIAKYWKMHSDPARADFRIIVNEKKFNVHKSVMEAASPFFANLFKSNMKESLNNSYTIHQYKPETIENLLKFIYAAKLPVNFENNAQELYEAAHYYGLEKLKVICAQKITPHLSSANAIKLHSWACLYDLEELKRDAWKVIKRDILKIYFPIKGEPLTPAGIQEIIDRQKAERQFWENLKDDKGIQ